MNIGIHIEIEEPPAIYNRDRMRTAMKEKLVTVSNTEKLQISTLVTDSWSQKYCSKYLEVPEYLIRCARELKQRKAILAQNSKKKSKAMTKETIDLAHGFYDDEYSRQLPGKKGYENMQKDVHKQKWLVLHNLHEFLLHFEKFRCENWILHILYSLP